jgi:3-hydroxyisobutyrate dehydrogenase
MEDELKISIIGLGNMGIGIYKRLIDKGFSINGYDINKSLKNLIPNNLTMCVDDILKTSDLILFAVPSNKEISSLIENKKIKKNSILIDLTTSDPKDTIEINKKLKLRNINFYDVAMSGGALGAKNGTLTLMVGAKKNDLKSIEKILKAMSSNIFYYGSIGSGHLMKLLHNSVCHGIFMMMCEVGNLAEEAGISIDDLIKTFNCSNARSYISQERFPKHILNEKYDGKSLIKNLQKDLNMIKKFSNTKNTSNNYITMTNYLLSNFDAKFANNDFTEIYKLWNENIKK